MLKKEYNRVKYSKMNVVKFGNQGMKQARVNWEYIDISLQNQESNMQFEGKYANSDILKVQ